MYILSTNQKELMCLISEKLEKLSQHFAGKTINLAKQATMKQIIFLLEIEHMKNMLKSISIKLDQRLCRTKEYYMSLVESQDLQQFNDVTITKCIQKSCKVRWLKNYTTRLKKSSI